MEVWFEGLTCTASGKNLLDNVSGRFLPGELTGILGASGAGKTTLLNAVSGYRRRGVTGRTSRTISSYIGHEDMLDPLLTAKELMDFAARFKLPPSHIPKQRSKAVEEVLAFLGLKGCGDTRTCKLSGGERRRLSIALELINNPPILFLDEPTSGLDTVAASQLVHLLSKLSHEGRTIIITIHQPSALIFDLFDRVYVMARGKCVYQGGPGLQILRYLESSGFVCPVRHNPADFVIELTEDKQNIEILCRASENGRSSWFLESGHSSKDCNIEISPVKCDQPNVGCISGKKHGSGELFWMQFSTIFYRIMLLAMRNKAGLILQICHHLCCGTVVGAIFCKRANDGANFVNHLNLALSVILFHTYTMQMVAILYYPFEVKMLKKEHFNQWYGLFPYYLAYAVAKTPVLVSLNLLYSIMVYSLIGLPWELDRFLYFCLAGLMIALVAESAGLTIGALFSATNGSIMGPLTMAPFLGLAIYGLDFMKSISPMMDFLTQTSYMRSGLVSIIMIQFGLTKRQLDCSEEFCPYKDPGEIFNFLTLQRFTIPEVLGHLAINLLLYRLTFFLALKWRLRR